ncbi:PREDICTED: lysine-specific demethylase 8-like [Branchiostoma belcheri]|uniref:Lysine-specific demethylase 8-like n=1 Tax=Branchiostoma belcheri TaxID=7741 RepID=A0A6P4YPG6_BRABE|nr:PREDICTED: lysine-specific demethylase 8-like [Branchiostoma belcheri]
MGETLLLHREAMFVTLLLLFLATGQGEEPPAGHLQPLGAHQPPVGQVESLDYVPTPEDFYHNYIQPGKPVIFRGAAKHHPAFQKWSDLYIMEKYGDVEVEVDFRKKENRDRPGETMMMEKFLLNYNASDFYMVTTVPEPMMEEVYLPSCLSCGGFTSRLQDYVMWFSSGGTKSHLHMDNIDNVMCMVSGSKEWFMLDRQAGAKVRLDRSEGAYSTVDVDRVDMYKYPEFRTLPWWSADIGPGDCLYVPYAWLHQVRSHGRNIAVNNWWTPLSEFDYLDCQGKDTKAPIPLSTLSFNPGAQTRFIVKVLLEEHGGQLPKATVQRWILWEHNGQQLISDQDFSQMDSNGDGQLSTEEMDQLELGTIHELFDGIHPGEINTIGAWQSRRIAIQKLLDSLDTPLESEAKEFLYNWQRTDEETVEFLAAHKGSLPEVVVEFMKSELKVRAPISGHEDL